MFFPLFSLRRNLISLSGATEAKIKKRTDSILFQCKARREKLKSLLEQCSAPNANLSSVCLLDTVAPVIDIGRESVQSRWDNITPLY